MSETDIFAHRLDTLHEDVGEIKSALKELANATTKLILVEERQAQTAATLDRVVATLDKLTARVTDLELAQPAHTRTSIWVDRAIWAVMGFLLMYVAKTLGL